MIRGTTLITAFAVSRAPVTRADAPVIPGSSGVAVGFGSRAFHHPAPLCWILRRLVPSQPLTISRTHFITSPRFVKLYLRRFTAAEKGNRPKHAKIQKFLQTDTFSLNKRKRSRQYFSILSAPQSLLVLNVAGLPQKPRINTCRPYRVLRAWEDSSRGYRQPDSRW